MKKIFQILCFLLIPALFFVGCSFDGTHNRNLGITQQDGTMVDGYEYITPNYDTDKEWSEITAEEIAAQNPINEPDPSYYASKYVFKFLGEDTLPIGGYTQPSTYNLDAAGTSLETYVREYVESGCNILVETHGAEADVDQESILRYLEQYGGMAFMVTSQLQSAYGAVKDEARKFALQYDKYAKYASFAGIHGADEPGWISWMEGINTPGTIGYGQQILNYVYNSKLYFINLLPIYSPDWAFPNGPQAENQLLDPSADYNYYYSSYVKEVNPKMLCYDYYPLKGAFPGLKEQHFLQLALIKYYTTEFYQEHYESINGKSTTNYIPFWNFIQIIGYGGTRGATYAELVWQMNTALNFGSKGFAYYTYYSPDSPNSVVNHGGERTASYYNMQKANQYTQAFGKWVLNADLDAIIQYGATPNAESIPDRNADTEKGKMLVYDINGNDYYYGMNMQKANYRMLKETSGDVPHLISYMDYYTDNNNYDKFVAKEDARTQDLIFVTNNTLNKSGDVKLAFDKEVSGEYVVGGKTFSFTGSSLTVNLGAGEAFAVLLDA